MGESEGHPTIAVATTPMSSASHCAALPAFMRLTTDPSLFDNVPARMACAARASAALVDVAKERLGSSKTGVICAKEGTVGVPLSSRESSDFEEAPEEISNGLRGVVTLSSLEFNTDPSTDSEAQESCKLPLPAAAEDTHSVPLKRFTGSNQRHMV